MVFDGVVREKGARALDGRDGKHFVSLKRGVVWSLGESGSSMWLFWANKLGDLFNSLIP